MADIDLAPWQRIIWQRLLDTARAACKGDPDEEGERDAAESLGLIAPGRKLDQDARATAASHLRAEVWQATGHPLALDLRLDRVDRCTEAFAPACPLRADHACPRNIRYAQRQKRLQQARGARSRGVPDDLAQKAALGELAETEALRIAGRFVDGHRNVLVLSNDEGGEGTQAAAWAMFAMESGRFVPMARLRFARRDDALVHEVLAAQVLALDGVVDLPRPAQDMLDAVIESVCRGRGKLVLTTPQQSKDFLAGLSERVQGLVKKHGDVVPVNPEQGGLAL